MARSKSIPGKTSNSKTGKDQPSTGAAPNLSEVNTSGETSAEVVADARAAREAGVTPEGKAIPQSPAVARVASDSKPGSDGRKFEVVKTDSRKNLVPINLEDEIRRRAYELYEQRGSSSGSEAEDWLAAESEVRQRYRQQSA
jgi:Protein of unknown function (DUF2934)